jgi:hypothetical protein
MANEATIRAGLSIRKAKLDYRSNPQQFTATVNGNSGPTPGAVTAATTGTTVNLSQLTAMGGLCLVMNLDSTNFVEYGVYNGATFFPLGELLPGEFSVIRLSRNLQHGETGTATINSLRLRADTAPCRVLIEAFDP